MIIGASKFESSMKGGRIKIPPQILHEIKLKNIDKVRIKSSKYSG